MMSREFTTREKILLLVLCVLLLGIVYYEFIIKYVDETIKQYNRAFDRAGQGAEHHGYGI